MLAPAGGSASAEQGTLPPIADPAQHSLDLSRFRDEKRAFFSADVTARYLTERITAIGIRRDDSRARGDWSWVARECSLTPAAQFVLACALAGRADASIGAVCATCQNDLSRPWPTLQLAQRLWDDPLAIAACADASHALFRYRLVHLPAGRDALDWQQQLEMPALVAQALIDPNSLPPLSPQANGARESLPREMLPMLARLRSDPPSAMQVLPLQARRGTDFAEWARALASRERARARRRRSRHGARSPRLGGVGHRELASRRGSALARALARTLCFGCCGAMACIRCRGAGAMVSADHRRRVCVARRSGRVAVARAGSSGTRRRRPNTTPGRRPPRPLAVDARGDSGGGAPLSSRRGSARSRGGAAAGLRPVGRRERALRHVPCRGSGGARRSCQCGDAALRAERGRAACSAGAATQRDRVRDEGARPACTTSGARRGCGTKPGCRCCSAVLRAPARPWRPKRWRPSSSCRCTASICRRWSTSTSARPRRTCGAFSTPPRRATACCSSTRPTRCSASARKSGRARPLRQHRDQLSARAHGALQGPRDARDQSPQGSRRSVHATPALHRRVSGAGRGGPRAHLATSLSTARRRVGARFRWLSQQFDLSGGHIRSVGVQRVPAGSGRAGGRRCARRDVARAHAIKRELEKMGRLAGADLFGRSAARGRSEHEPHTHPASPLKREERIAWHIRSCSEAGRIAQLIPSPSRGGPGAGDGVRRGSSVPLATSTIEERRTHRAFRFPSPSWGGGGRVPEQLGLIYAKGDRRSPLAYVLQWKGGAVVRHLRAVLSFPAPSRGGPGWGWGSLAVIRITQLGAMS